MKLEQVKLRHIPRGKMKPNGRIKLSRNWEDS